MFKRYFFFFSFFLFASLQLTAQYDAPLYTSYTTEAARAKLKERLIKNSITKNLLMPLTDSTEENWEDAFSAMEVLGFSSPFTQGKIHSAFDNIESRSIYFQRALMELAYTNYPGKYISKAGRLMDFTYDPKIFSMCAEYLMQNTRDTLLKHTLSLKLFKKFGDSVYINPVLTMLQNRLQSVNSKYKIREVLSEIFNRNYLPGEVIMYSFQRKNRDYPGMVVIRDKGGNFIIDSSGKLFTIPQLARSITNLPGYLTNGNTPQGLFRMYGFGVSMSNFIGPTANVQMGMPVELSVSKFLDDSTITDSVWTINWYQKLLPQKIKNFLPLYDSYYSGLAGRSEIIAHGSTIDPDYYIGKTYFPLTPSQGCLCTREIWNGKRLESDQQKLVNGLLQAGGAYGYCIVLELDDKRAPVVPGDILPYLPK